MHGHRLIIGAGVHELDAAGEAQLHAHQAGQDQGDQADEDSRQGILNGYDLVVLAPDITGQEALGLVQLLCFDLFRVSHHVILRVRVECIFPA
ncbi:hypothetical protein D3C80_1410200 [compost metagenome]